MLLDGPENVMTHVIGCERYQTILAAFPTIQQAAKGRDAIQSAGHTDLLLHNLTNPTCPKWITDIVVSDPDYCSRRANSLEKRAGGIRRQADVLELDAQRLEEASDADWVRRLTREV